MMPLVLEPMVLLAAWGVMAVGVLAALTAAMARDARCTAGDPGAVETATAAEDAR